MKMHIGIRNGERSNVSIPYQSVTDGQTDAAACN